MFFYDFTTELFMFFQAYPPLTTPKIFALPNLKAFADDNVSAATILTLSQTTSSRLFQTKRVCKFD